jgi:hypothetical protein
MARRWDWVSRLHDAVEAARLRPFDYGTENCALFAAQVVDAIVEDSHIEEEIRARVNSVESAARFLNAEGGLEDAVTTRLGQPVAWPRAMRGDVCLMPTQDGPALGVCMGGEVAMMSTAGISYLRIDQALKVWGVE